MNNAYKMKELELAPFKVYLRTEAKLSELTTNDYVKRIITICKEENIDISALFENIDKISFDYTEGNKQDLGRRSHNSYRSALLQFKKFVSSGGAINSNSKKPKWHFEVNQVPGEGFGTIKLYDENNNLIDTQFTLDMHHHTSQEGSRDVALKCIDMMFKNAYNKDTTKLYEVLGTLDCSLTVSGKKIVL